MILTSPWYAYTSSSRGEAGRPLTFVVLWTFRSVTFGTYVCQQLSGLDWDGGVWCVRLGLPEFASCPCDLHCQVCDVTLREPLYPTHPCWKGARAQTSVTATSHTETQVRSLIRSRVRLFLARLAGPSFSVFIWIATSFLGRQNIWESLAGFL